MELVSHTLPWEPTVLMPMGDLQYGAAGSKLDRFKRDLDWGMKNNAIFIGMGDYVDVASPSGRSKWRSQEWYDSVRQAMDDRNMELLEVVKKAVDGTQGRWLGLHEGHHYWDFEDIGETTDTLLAKYLQAPFLETTAITQVRFKGDIRKGGRHSTAIEIYSTHGAGSGVTMASPLNKLERQLAAYPTVRIFLLGHYSRAVTYDRDGLVPKFGKHARLYADPRILACTGGYMVGYNTREEGHKGRNRGSYVEKGMMPPTNLGGVKIYMEPFSDGVRDRIRLETGRTAT